MKIPPSHIHRKRDLDLFHISGKVLYIPPDKGVGKEFPKKSVRRRSQRGGFPPPSKKLDSISSLPNSISSSEGASFKG